MFAQLPPLPLQSCHRYAYEVGSSIQVPVDVVNVLPATGLPVIVGAPMFTGGSVGTGSAGGVGFGAAGAAGLPEVVVAGGFVEGSPGFVGAKVPKVSGGPLALAVAWPVA